MKRPLLVLLILFNKDRAYLLYALYMRAFFLNQVAQERLFAQYITPNQPWGFFWFVLLGGLTAAFGLEFFSSFIEPRSSMPDRYPRFTWQKQSLRYS